MINPQNKDNMCFQYAITTSLNYKKIKNHPEKISKINPFINNYNWDNMQLPSQQQDYEKFEMNNKSISLNVLHIQHDTKNIKYSYKSKFNYTREHQAILLMIKNGKKCHYLAVKKLSALLRKTSNHGGDSYCINCFKAFRTISRFETHKKILLITQITFIV